MGTPKTYKQQVGNGYDGNNIETLKEQKCVVLGNIAVNPPPGAKTSGIKTRGNGAATKGTMARGPMA
jgi:hypothetical protein